MDIEKNKKYQREWKRKKRASSKKYREKDIFYAKRWQKEHPIRAFMNNCRRGAIKRGYKFELNNIEVEKLITGNCNYCGSSPAPYNGIDRFDNTIGYIFSNCVSCCFNCNRAKGELSIGQFNDLIIKIYNRILKINN